MITFSLFAKVVVTSWLLAQSVVSGFEIRQQGWSAWRQMNIQRSYLQYLNSFTYRQWLRLGAWFFLVFHLLLAGLCFRYFYFR